MNGEFLAFATDSFSLKTGSELFVSGPTEANFEKKLIVLMASSFLQLTRN